MKIVIWTLLFLAVGILVPVNYFQDQTIRQQKFTIENMAANPLCMADPTGLPGHKVAPKIVVPKHKAVLRHVYFTTPNPPQRSI